MVYDDLGISPLDFRFTYILSMSCKISVLILRAGFELWIGFERSWVQLIDM